MDIALSGHYGYRRLLRTAAPCVAMMLVSSVYGIVDGLFVSNFAGTTGFAAVNLMWPAIMVLGALGMMVGSGGAGVVLTLLFCAFLLVRFAPQLVLRKGN